VTLAEVQARQGTRLMGLGQAEAARLAMWPPIEIPWQHSGPRPCFSAQFNSTYTKKTELTTKPDLAFQFFKADTGIKIKVADPDQHYFWKLDPNTHPH
jgi:hypothetical protein